MNPTELLDRLSRTGVTLFVEGGGLRFRAPKGALTPELRDAIGAHKAELLHLLSEDGQPRFPRDPDARFQPFPLTDLQQAYVIGESDFYRNATVANLYQRYRVPGLDVERFRAAVRAVVDTHDVLRTTLLPDRRQVVRPPFVYEPKLEDLRSLVPEQAARRVADASAGIVDQLAPLEEGPNWHVGVQQFDDHAVVHFVVRLLAFDAVTLHAIYRDLIGFYEDSSYEPALSELSYRDYVLGIERYKASARYRSSLSYWKERVQNLPPAPDLPHVRGGAANTVRLERLSGRLPRDVWSELRTHARALGRPINSVLCTAYTDTLARWATNRAFTINVLSANRPPSDPETARVVGNCSTTSLVAIPEGGVTFAERVEGVQRRLYADLAHNAVSGVEVIRELARLRPGAGDAPMPIVFTSGIALLGGSESFELLVPRDDWTLEEARLSTPQVLLDHQVMEERGELVFNWDYAKEHFPSGMVEEMFEHYREHLGELAASPASFLAPTHPLSSRHLAARRRANETRRELPRATLYELFERTAIEHPERPAILSELGSLDFGAARSFASTVRMALQARGVERGDLVGVYLTKGAEQAVATLGVLQAGAAYLPLDAKLPAARVQQILAHSGARAVLVDGETATRLGESDVAVVPMPKRPDAKLWVPGVEVRDDEVAYVIYTSGSTGQPKGVVIDHRGAVNTILDINRRFGVTADDRILGLSSLGFDLSVFDLFGAFAAGAAVVVPREEEIPNPRTWIAAMERFHPTVWNSVPALLEITIEHQGDDLRVLDSLRLILLSGDWIPLPLVARLLERCPQARCVGLGGATEASIWSNYFEIDAIAPTWTSVPYGLPLANQTFAVLDRDLQHSPHHVMGDLYIGGVGLAKGYLNDPDKTAASFITHPHSGERLYRTGDRGCYRPDGVIEFGGREDAQVKIRGFRVELGEIEFALLSSTGIEAAVAVVQGGGTRDQRLVAFVVAPELSVERLESIRVALADRLPEYMVPAVIVPIAAVPLGPNGKVDRKSLKAATSIARAKDASQRTPLRSETEIRLGALWREVLGIDTVFADDDFFTSGGNSLQAVRLFSGIERVFQRRLPLSSLFRSRSLSAQAALLDEAEETSRRTPGLVTLRSGERDDVLVLIHPVGGDVLCYEELARRLPAGLTVAGIRSPLLDAESSSDLDLESLASSYARAVLDGYPRATRLHLGGWSMGGVLAYECARQLLDLGRAVETVVLIDSWLGRLGVSRGEVDMVMGFFADLLGTRAATADIEVHATSDAFTEVYGRLQANGRLPKELDLPRAARLYAVHARNMRALEAFQPRSCSVPALVFRATEHPAAAFSNLRPFSDRATALLGDHAYVELRADHFGIMRGAALATVAAGIAERI